MADGITGLNPIRAKQQIEELNINLSSVQNDFVSKTQNFLSSLSELWYSEKAVEFSNNIISSSLIAKLAPILPLISPFLAQPSHPCPSTLALYQILYFL